MKKFKLEVKTVKKIIISTLLVIALVVQFAFLSYLFKAISPNKKTKIYIYFVYIYY